MKCSTVLASLVLFFHSTSVAGLFEEDDFGGIDDYSDLYRRINGAQLAEDGLGLAESVIGDVDKTLESTTAPAPSRQGKHGQSKKGHGHHAHNPHHQGHEKHSKHHEHKKHAHHGAKGRHGHKKHGHHGHKKNGHHGHKKHGHHEHKKHGHHGGHKKH